MPYALPPKYRFPYDYSIYLHDFLSGLVHAGEALGVFNVRLVLNKKDPQPPETLDSQGLPSWLEEHYPKAALELNYKSLLVAILADTCHFVWESLRASARGKQTVAYALSRKPFKDNLFYLEWLLADPSDFLQRLNRGPEEIAVDDQTPEARQSIIEEAVRKSESSGLNGAVLYEVRYDKKVEYGYAVAWDQAIHLVTTFKHAKTSRGNVNMIFSSHPEQQEALWEYYYRLIPHLLYHTVYVANALLGTIGSYQEPQSSLHKMRRDLGFVLHSEWLMGQKPSAALLAARELLGELKCAKCGSSFVPHTRNVKSFVIRGALGCRKCNTLTILPK